ncbi:TetR/AcrR family transcriptional regulator [Zavarzinia compransoris]|uniref:TetR/AcrR family transcriptional regulator n=1 Tax=Zavarzinia compransoris TaxID=1264899 RepID=A0A317E5K3_9PROT|nr:TetR/AcrR family transcriptional regulator [Zavarzinia compransoris]PWR20623.1 TetR/AcrR family transcriptional regulator [Zavarzinia compransoris]TDP44561.1 TetR family transcriptional regulator [Zavarzinia compransoris]
MTQEVFLTRDERPLSEPAEAAGVGIRQRQKAARPGQIIEAAFAEFAEKGYAAARLEDVARRIGITKGTIYHYFPGKEDLFKAMVMAHLLPLIDGLKAIAGDEGTGGVTLLRLLLERAWHDMVGNEKSREFVRLLVGEASRVPELAQFFQRELTSRAEELIAAVIERGVATGEFHAEAAKRLAGFPDAIMAPAVMACFQAVLISGAGMPLPDIVAMKEAHLHLLLNGLLVRP